MRTSQKHFLSIPVLAALALLFVGCSVGRLSDRIVIDRWTQSTDADGREISIGGNGDFLHATSLDAAAGITLGPGDVLRYVRWSPGYADSRLVAGNGQTHEPSSDVYEVALRRIADGGHLHPDEERFLSSVLTVHRLNWESTSFGASEALREGFLARLTAALERMQVPLWNSLSESIVVRRLRLSSDRPTVLVATIDMNELCNRLSKVDPGDVTLFARAFIHPEGNPDFTGCDDKDRLPEELTAAPSALVLDSPYKAAVDSPPPPREVDPNNPNVASFRYFVLGDAAYAQLNFVKAEVNGVRVDDRRGPAADWTLREWEQSGVCTITGNGSVPVIRRIRLLGGRRKLWISRTRPRPDPDPTYQVVTRLFDGGASRTIERIKAHEQRPVLPASVLDHLRMSDLDFIEWAHPKMEIDLRRSRAVVTPDGCTFPGSR